MKRLVLFDLDGTLVDSHAHITAAMRAAHGAVGLVPPPTDVLLSVVGLSLPQAMRRLQPELDAERLAGMQAAYRASYFALRSEAVPPLFAGVEEVLADLAADPSLAMGVATGASRRGLTGVLDHHGIARHFDTIQCADDHPSKPDPSMVRAALAETGSTGGVMIGDTTFDMEMARDGGLAALGVSWGHHPPDRLRAAGAGEVVDQIGALAPAIRTALEAVDG